jgi:hypothetical protein
MMFSSLTYTSTLKMESKYFSETQVNFQRTARHYTPEGRTLHSHGCENFKSCNIRMNRPRKMWSISSLPRKRKKKKKLRPLCAEAHSNANRGKRQYSYLFCFILNLKRSMSMPERKQICLIQLGLPTVYYRSPNTKLLHEIA